MLPSNTDTTPAEEAGGVFDEIRKIIRKQKQSSGKNKTNAEEYKSNSYPLTKFTEFVNSHSSHLLNSDSHNTNNDDSAPSQVTDKNSPFVSNTLDEFLTGDSKLNISYKIPKCGAEEGLTDTYPEESPLVLKKVVRLGNHQVQVGNQAKTLKAKTVAQKRKLLERQRLKELKRAKLENKQPVKELPPADNSNSHERNSYVEVDGKKVWVTSTKSNGCIAKIKSIKAPPKPEPAESPGQFQKRRKLSLLNELGKKCTEKIRYRPGPLSKKPGLQVSGQDEWKTESRLLPKVYLDVCPQIGRSLPPHIINMIPPSRGIVTPNLAEFALSVLKTKENNSTSTNKRKIFKFPVKYRNNQEKILVKKRKSARSKYSIGTKSDVDQNCVESVVANIIDDLIRYVEIKEIAPTLIKEEECEYSRDASEPDQMPYIADNISSIIKKSQKKKSKVELELHRLSCKVVNVEVEENSAEESCDKPFCRLGCVCKSLKCDGMITYHCQNLGCMLECKCPRGKSIEYDKLMLPPGTDILSTDTVTRIEDEAKKDLAKVEREFTQTVIHTSDKTIVVGTGGRYKTRRCAKTPVKYSDFVNSDTETVKEEKVEVQAQDQLSIKCFVSLPKLNLQDLVPYCWPHKSYNCQCESISSCTPPHKPVTRNKAVNKENKPVEPKPQQRPSRAIRNTPPTLVDGSSSQEIVSASGRHIRVSKRLQDNYTYLPLPPDPQLFTCARTRRVPPSQVKNRSRSNKAYAKLTKGDFSNNISQADILKAKIYVEAPGVVEAETLKRNLALESGAYQQSVSAQVEKCINASRHKRKQTLEVRTEDMLPSQVPVGTQRPKRKKLVETPPPPPPPPPPPSPPAIQVEPIFEGEIIVDKNNMDLLQKMGNRTVMEGYARLLPWKALVTSFETGDIQIWCMIDLPTRLLINKRGKTPPKNFIDIRQSKHTTEVILWILSKRLPRRYHEDHLSFILKQTKDNYEICGLCTKNFNSTSADEATNSVNDILAKVKNDKNASLFKHKDLNGVQQLMCLTKGKYNLQELVEENLASLGDTSVRRNHLYMWVALPEIYNTCKWRMIFLNSDFSFLYFTKMKYSIKYADLLTASTKAKQENCTVILRNSIICVPYDHSAFGIYFDAHYQDRLFIGPYFKQHCENDVETLRYINQALVCTESFNKMQGKDYYKCGHWLVERPYVHHRRPNILGMTRDNVLEKCLENNDTVVKKPTYGNETGENVIITPNNERIRILDGAPRRPEEFNRYIITNIPHLGYLGAFQHEDSSEIDVSWPFENKMLRFQTVRSAIEFLQSRFASLLQPVPETFKISIIVLTSIDLEKTKPIDASILSGRYMECDNMFQICGEFGCYNVKTMTDEICINKIGTTREELLRLFAKRAQNFVRQKIHELADVVDIPVAERQDILGILKKSASSECGVLFQAQEHIYSLKETEMQHGTDKNALLLRKRDLALQAFRLISVLPEKEKSLEGWKFRQILRKQSLLVPQTTTKPIEISDSEEEEDTTNRNNADAGESIPVVDVDVDATNSDSEMKEDEKELVESKESMQPEVIQEEKNELVENAQAKQSEVIQILVENQNTTPALAPSCSGSVHQVDQAQLFTHPVTKKLTSVLKPIVAPNLMIPRLVPLNTHFQSPRAPNLDNSQYLKGVKIVKTTNGKLILMPDHVAAKKEPYRYQSVGGKQVVIKDGHIMSYKHINPEKQSEAPVLPKKTILVKTSNLSPHKEITVEAHPRRQFISVRNIKELMNKAEELNNTKEAVRRMIALNRNEPNKTVDSGKETVTEVIDLDETTNSNNISEAVDDTSNVEEKSDVVSGTSTEPVEGLYEDEDCVMISSSSSSEDGNDQDCNDGPEIETVIQNHVAEENNSSIDTTTACNQDEALGGTSNDEQGSELHGNSNRTPEIATILQKVVGHVIKGINSVTGEAGSVQDDALEGTNESVSRLRSTTGGWDEPAPLVQATINQASENSDSNFDLQETTGVPNVAGEGTDSSKPNNTDNDSSEYHEFAPVVQGAINQGLEKNDSNLGSTQNTADIEDGAVSELDIAADNSDKHSETGSQAMINQASEESDPNRQETACIGRYDEAVESTGNAESVPGSAADIWNEFVSVALAAMNRQSKKNSSNIQGTTCMEAKAVESTDNSEAVPKLDSSPGNSNEMRLSVHATVNQTSEQSNSNLNNKIQETVCIKDEDVEITDNKEPVPKPDNICVDKTFLVDAVSETVPSTGTCMETSAVTLTRQQEAAPDETSTECNNDESDNLEESLSSVIETNCLEVVPAAAPDSNLCDQPDIFPVINDSLKFHTYVEVPTEHQQGDLKLFTIPESTKASIEIVKNTYNNPGTVKVTTKATSSSFEVKRNPAVKEIVLVRRSEGITEPSLKKLCGIKKCVKRKYKHINCLKPVNKAVKILNKMKNVNGNLTSKEFTKTMENETVIHEGTSTSNLVGQVVGATSPIPAVATEEIENSSEQIQPPPVLQRYDETETCTSNELEVLDSMTEVSSDRTLVIQHPLEEIQRPLKNELEAYKIDELDYLDCTQQTTVDSSQLEINSEQIQPSPIVENINQTEACTRTEQEVINCAQEILPQETTIEIESNCSKKILPPFVVEKEEIVTSTSNELNNPVHENQLDTLFCLSPRSDFKLDERQNLDFSIETSDESSSPPEQTESEGNRNKNPANMQPEIQSTDMFTTNIVANEKFPKSKRISNIVVHTLQPQLTLDNNSSIKENTSIEGSKKLRVVIVPMKHDGAEKPEQVDLVSSVTHTGEQELSSTTSNALCPPKKCYKYTGPQVDPVFMIDDELASKKRKRSRKLRKIHKKFTDEVELSLLLPDLQKLVLSKGTGKHLPEVVDEAPLKPEEVVTAVKDSAVEDLPTGELVEVPATINEDPTVNKGAVKCCKDSKSCRKLPPGRRRQEQLFTTDLVYASIVVTSDPETKKNTESIDADNVETSSHLDEDIEEMPQLTPELPTVINKDSFLKNAVLADKCIDIGNLKKKLRANLSKVNERNSDDSN
ncbi:hypothetical protein NQ315_007813 [Exocentrus adspersus]|uniref:MGA conserved domain-containing protein n=1 Tax=Exocentrus adspersus TaxID=1586481 RepID=A0AAV8W816_9CUCU|nr:hypothetical protein NQ315_007813 [Exocentrus adspersus]